VKREEEQTLRGESAAAERRIGVRLASWLGGKDDLLAGTFASVESLIGGGKQLFEAVTHFILLPAGGEGDGYFLSLPEDFERAEALENKLQLLQGAFREDDKKFVTAQTDGEVRAADDLVEMGGEFLENVVTSGMAVLVVDLFE